MTTHLLVIDPQHDFCDPTGALFVPGADADMARLADLVRRHLPRIDAIHVTLDSHHLLDVAHPAWWRDAAGTPPAPFTLVSAADLAAGRFTTADPSARERTLAYLTALEARGRYRHCIWPPHCLLGSPGHAVVPDLAAAVSGWSAARLRRPSWVLKGLNPWTEHFSGIEAEIPDPGDPSTSRNDALLAALATAGTVLVAGEARSHCVASTVRDLVAALDPAARRRVVLLVDAMTDVPDPPGTTLFSDLGRRFVDDMVALGVRTGRTTDPDLLEAP